MAQESGGQPGVARGSDAVRHWFDSRAARLAIAGMLAILVAVTGFVLWASLHTADVTDRVIASSHMSDHYDQAMRAFIDEESLERKYRLEPGDEVLARYDAASAELVAALNLVRTEGGADDARQANDVLVAHIPYVVATKRMFSAVDQGNNPAVLTIDREEIDPKFVEIKGAIQTAARQHKERAESALDELDRVESFTSKMTPLVFSTGLVGVLAFASVLLRVRRQLDRQIDEALHHSLHDALTGLPNRELASDRLEAALDDARRAGHSTGLLLIDLDRFKEVNDTLGHNVGDSLLQLVGTRLIAAVREEDTVARLGGDEFAIVLPHIEGLAGAMLVAEKLSATMSEPFSIDGIDLVVEASIGVVVSPVHGDGALALFQHADVAMYVAKEQGIGVFAYEPDLDRHSLQRLSLLGELRRALESDEFELHYQPQLALDQRRFVGAEALIRWQHPSRGLIGPNEFLPLAEHTGLIDPLTHMVVDMALTQIRAWLDAGVRIPVAVNVSARNLINPQFVDEVLGLLDRHDVPAALLGLELTESAVMTEPIGARQTLERFREHGIQIALDDFGSGFTSLTQLKTLPITELKIDGSFVTTMDTDAGNALIVVSVIELGHNLGLTVVAEGVESEKVLNILIDKGCDTAQGFHLCRPLRADDLLEHAWPVPS